MLRNCTADWLQPVSGSELAEPFSGAVRFNQVRVTSNLPQNRFAHLTAGRSYTFDVTVRNTGLSPEAFFLHPRTNGTESVQLADLNGSDQDMTLPLRRESPSRFMRSRRTRAGSRRTSPGRHR
jgi:hypothetical protein